MYSNKKSVNTNYILSLTVHNNKKLYINKYENIIILTNLNTHEYLDDNVMLTTNQS